MRRRQSSAGALSPWPGYVDALSTLLMVLVFVLLVFVLSQAFLSVAIGGRDQALDRLGRQVAELADLLSLERGKTADLAARVAGLSADLQAARVARDAAAAEAAGVRDALAKAVAARDAAVGDAGGLRARLSDQTALAASAEARIAGLQERLAAADARSDAAARAEVAQLSDQVRGLMALRDELAARATVAAGKQADAEKLAASSAAQVALLTHQIDALRQQLAALQAALDGARKAAGEKDAKIADLGSKLNAALVGQVQELQRYRSEFFGRLRAVLAGRPGISEVGDRFVFQSEVLFPVGSAELSPAGVAQIRKLAATLKAIAADIPPGVNWVLRVDGHADRQQIHGRFASNWELSAARAISVVRLLIAEGVPAPRLAAAGFGEFQPLDPRATEAAYARNRRIELRLTDR